MIIGGAQKFAMTQLAGGAGGAAKTKGDVKSQHKKAAKKLAGGMSGAEKSKDTGKQQETKKKKDSQKQEGLQKFGSEAFVQKEEMPDQDNLKKMDNLRQQAKDMKFPSQAKGKPETSGFTGTKFSSTLKGLKFNKGIRPENKGLIEDQMEELIDVQSDSGQIQLHTGLTKKGIQKKKGDHSSEAVAEQEEAKKKQESVQGKGSQDSTQGDGQSGEKSMDLETVKKLEKAEAIKNSTPVRDAAEAADGLKEFQKQTGVSTKALEKSNQIAKTIVDESDGAKKAKRTRMRPVKDVQKIVGNEKSAPMKDIEVKNEPLAMLPLNGKMGSGETELVKTKLPEEEPDAGLNKMEGKPIGASPSMGEAKEAGDAKVVTHVGSQSYNLNHTEPQSVTGGR